MPKNCLIYKRIITPLKADNNSESGVIFVNNEKNKNNQSKNENKNNQNKNNQNKNDNKYDNQK